MNSVKSKTSYSHRQILNLTDKINLKKSDKYVALSHIITIHGKIKKVIQKQQI